MVATLSQLFTAITAEGAKQILKYLSGQSTVQMVGSHTAH